MYTRVLTVYSIKTVQDHPTEVFRKGVYLLAGKEELLVLSGDVFGLLGNYCLLERAGTAFE